MGFKCSQAGSISIRLAEVALSDLPDLMILRACFAVVNLKPRSSLANVPVPRLWRATVCVHWTPNVHQPKSCELRLTVRTQVGSYLRKRNLAKQALNQPLSFTGTVTPTPPPTTAPTTFITPGRGSFTDSAGNVYS